ncbi:MAG: S1 RNA-binding domain-containing protein [Candidatus Eremiobacteraeota bacterium]|nr:S1 RNA-binding domain-containing protein [Candidatus Eremiobacteraeota bacterium]
MALEIGTIVNGVIMGMTDFGAFVKLPDGNSGFIHISEIAPTFVQDIRKHLSQGDTVTVKILGINEKGEYDLSIKQAMVQEESHGERTTSQSKEKFEEMMSRFLKESSEHQLALKRNTQSKLGGKRSR